MLLGLSLTQSSAILYPFKHDIEGGFLEIKYNNDPDSVERIAPIHNRHIMFDPSSFHREVGGNGSLKVCGFVV